jgi:hypothetical protein
MIYKYSDNKRLIFIINLKHYLKILLRISQQDYWIHKN